MSEAAGSDRAEVTDRRRGSPAAQSLAFPCWARKLPFRLFKPHNLLTAWSAAGHLEGKKLQFQRHATRFV